MPTFQFAEVTATTDPNGYFTFDFDAPIDAVIVGPNGPQSGADAGIVSATALKTGTTTVKVRAWNTTQGPDQWSVRAANSKQVTVTLLGLSA